MSDQLLVDRLAEAGVTGLKGLGFLQMHWLGEIGYRALHPEKRDGTACGYTDDERVLSSLHARGLIDRTEAGYRYAYQATAVLVRVLAAVEVEDAPRRQENLRAGIRKDLLAAVDGHYGISEERREELVRELVGLLALSPTLARRVEPEPSNAPALLKHLRVDHAWVLRQPAADLRVLHARYHADDPDHDHRPKDRT